MQHDDPYSTSVQFKYFVVLLIVINWLNYHGHITAITTIIITIIILNPRKNKGKKKNWKVKKKWKGWCSGRSSKSKLLCNKTELNRNSKTEMHWNKKWLPCHLQTCEKSSDRGRLGTAGSIVHGAKKLHNNRLEDVLVFQCAVFRDLVGGGQLSNSTDGGGCRLQVRVGQWADDDRHIPTKGFAFLP